MRCGAAADDAADDFSGSPYCENRDVVLREGARLGGGAMAVVVAGNVACALLWAPYIDARGRRFVAVRSLAGLAVGFAALAAAAATLEGPNAVAASYAGFFVAAATSATTPALAAAASDLAPRDAASQRAALAVKGSAWGAGTVAAYAAGFYVLGLELERYAFTYPRRRRSLSRL